MSTLSQEKVAQIQGKIEQLDKGSFISFFDYPWEVRIPDLIVINKKWSQIIQI